MAALVFGPYTQAELDAQYDQGSLVPDRGPYYRRWREEGARARHRMNLLEAVPYGASPAETLDVFPADPSPCSGGTLHVHYHGGAWRALSSQDAWFIAEPWVADGHTFVSVNYGLVPEVGLARQVDQARKALVWCRDNAEALGVPSGHLTISGHSSGGHLAAMVALAEWEGMETIRPNIRGVIVASGTYDLVPVQLSARNGYLNLSEAEARALSPIRHLAERTPACAVVWSLDELPEFQRQSSEMAAALADRGAVHRYAASAGNHFDTWNLVVPGVLTNTVTGDRVDNPVGP